MTIDIKVIFNDMNQSESSTSKGAHCAERKAACFNNF